MKKEDLKLIAPDYQDYIEMDLEGDYNDGDYTSDSLWLTLEQYEVLMPVLMKSEGSHNWEKRDTFLKERLVELNITDNDLIIEYEDLIGEISLYGEDHSCHSMYIRGVWFQSASDNIRYIVKWN